MISRTMVPLLRINLLSLTSRQHLVDFFLWGVGSEEKIGARVILETRISYAGRVPRRPARAPTNKALRGSVETKGRPFPLPGGPFHLQ